MKNNLIKAIAVPAAAILLGVSCTKKIDDAYQNPNATVRVPVETLLPNIIANMAIHHTANGTLYGPQNDGLYIGRYVQYWATNTTLNQYDRMGGATSNSDILGSVWAAHYFGQGENLNKMVEWGAEEEKWDYVGVGLAIRAWSWLSLTSVYGEVILNQAFDKSRLVFEYDEQAEVYAEVRRLAHLALSYLERTDGAVSQANLALGDEWMNGGDREKWKKFAYGVLARSFNHLSRKTEYNPDSVIYYADRSALVNADNSSVKWSNAGNTGTYSYYSPFRGNVGTLRQTRFIADLMSGINGAFPTAVVDPRAPYIIRENPNGTYKGVRPNKGTDGLAVADRPDNFWGGLWEVTAAPANDNNSRYIFKNAPIWPVITAAEMKFNKAEAYYYKNMKQEARTAYLEGLKLHFNELRTNYEVSVPDAKKITQTAEDTYLANPLVVPAANDLTLSHIMLQKYIAMYGWGMLETWVDLRKYHYTDEVNGLQVYRDFAPPTGADLFTDNNLKWVYRARPRYNSEYLYNVEELRRIGALALDYHTLEQWFSKPD